MEGKLLIEVACNGRICDVCHIYENLPSNDDYTGYCSLFDENLEDNGEGLSLRCGACMRADQQP